MWIIETMWKNSFTIKSWKSSVEKYKQFDECSLINWWKSLSKSVQNTKEEGGMYEDSYVNCHILVYDKLFLNVQTLQIIIQFKIIY